MDKGHKKTSAFRHLSKDVYNIQSAILFLGFYPLAVLYTHLYAKLYYKIVDCSIFGYIYICILIYI